MLDSFCCCCGLKTAGKFIGWTSSVLSIIAILSLVMILGNWEHSRVYELLYQLHISPENAHIKLFITLILYSINLVASALLIAGTMKKRHLLLVPWLVISGVPLGILGIYVINMLIACTYVPFKYVASGLISGVLTFAFQWYIWYAIYSLYKNIQITNRNKQQLSLPPTTSTGEPYPLYNIELNNGNFV